MLQVVLQVALPTPLPRLFDYYAPLAGVPGIGMRVRVPFGPRQMVGFIAGISRRSDFASALKTAYKLIDTHFNTAFNAKPLKLQQEWVVINCGWLYDIDSTVLRRLESSFTTLFQEKGFVVDRLLISPGVNRMSSMLSLCYAFSFEEPPTYTE